MGHYQADELFKEFLAPLGDPLLTGTLFGLSTLLAACGSSNSDSNGSANNGTSPGGQGNKNLLLFVLIRIIRSATVFENFVFCFLFSIA